MHTTAVQRFWNPENFEPSDEPFRSNPGLKLGLSHFRVDHPNDCNAFRPHAKGRPPRRISDIVACGVGTKSLEKRKKS